MSWSYDIPEIREDAPVTTQAPTAVEPSVPPASELTPAEIDAIRNAPPEVQTQLATLLSNGLQGQELVSAIRDMLGADPAVMSPTGQGFANTLAQAQLASDNGMSSFTDQDIELVRRRVETITKQLMAQGATDAEIEQAAAQLAGSPEMVAIAKEAAQQQVDAQKFNLFSSRPAEAQAQDQGGQETMGALAAVLGLGAAAAVMAPQEQRPYDLPSASMEQKDMGPTGQALYLAGLTGGFTPSNVPDVRVELGIERGSGNSRSV